MTEEEVLAVGLKLMGGKVTDVAGQWADGQTAPPRGAAISVPQETKPVDPFPAHACADGPREILVLIPLEHPCNALVASAADIAREHRSRMTLLAVVPKLPPFLALGGLEPKSCMEASDRHAGAVLRSAAALIPCSVPVQMIVRHGSPHGRVLASLDDWHYDLVCVDISTIRWSWRARRHHRQLERRCEVCSVGSGHDVNRRGIRDTFTL